MTMTGQYCSLLMNLSPDGAVLVMTKFTLAYSLQEPGDLIFPTTSVFRYDGAQYEAVQSTIFPPGATSVSTNGTFLAVELYLKMMGTAWFATPPGGVFHYDAQYHQIDVYDDYGQKILDGGVLSADGTLLVTTTKWSPIIIDPSGFHWSLPEELGIFVYHDFAYHRNAIPSWTIEPRCLANFLPWRLSADGTFLNIGTCVFKQGRPIPVPPIWTGCTGTCVATSTALSSDGLVLAIGNSGDDGNIGAAWVFRYNGEAGEYNQVGGKLVGTSAASYQGTSVSLSSNGAVLAVGGPGYGSGAVWLYRYNGSTYQQVGDIVASDEYILYQGITVSLSSDGSFLAVGGVRNNQMLALVFRNEPEPPR